MLILIKGAGDLATGIACRLKVSGMQIIMTDIPIPTTVRRTVAFSKAVYEETATVEGITARLAKSPAEALAIANTSEIAVIIDPECDILHKIKFDAVVDAILAKHNIATNLSQAPVVIGVGPGFTAPLDCHCVVETARGHNLGRAIYNGEPSPNTGIPGNIGGFTTQRLIKSPCSGIFEPLAKIGDLVKDGQTVALVNNVPVVSHLDGVLRGLLQSGVTVTEGMKSGDVDPRCEISHCYTVSDKARAIAGGVLEGILALRAK